MSNQDVQGLLIQIEATTAQLRRELPLGEQSVSKFTKRVDRDLATVDSAFDRMGQQAQSSINVMRNAFGALAGAGVVGFALQQADAYGQMADRIRMAAKDTGEYEGVQQRLLATAGRTYRPLAEAQELYIRTADSLRSMGKETSAAMDVQDSLSYLLVTNSASAERATGAIDAYSKALQKGSIDADAWQSILTAMPTIVDVVAESTGKSAEEIRRLGAEGKLGLDMLTDALERSVEANGKLADSMGVAVRDALNNLNTAFAAYIGQANESHDVTGTLAAGIGVLSNNIDLVANGVGVVVVAALAAYTRSALGGAAASAKATITALEETSARRQQAAASLEAAIADQRKAQTAVFLAQKEATAAKGTAVQSQMSLQLAQARQTERAATDAVAAAQGRLRAASVGVMGLLGGPAGIAMLAAAAATAFLAFRDSSVEVEQKLEDLKRPLDEVISKFRTLNEDQRKAEIGQWAEKQRLAAEQVQEKFDDLAASMRAAIVPPGRDPSRGERLYAFTELLARMREAKAAGEALSPIIEEAAARFKISPENLTSWVQQAGEVSNAADNSGRAAQVMAALTAETDRNTASTGANNAAKAGMTSAGETYLQTLQKQLAGLQDNGDAVKAAERWVREHTDATEADKAAVMSAAYAIESQKESNKAATAATKEATSEAKKQAEQLLDYVAKSELAAAASERQAEAYWAGADAVSELARQEKIEAEVLKLGESARAQITEAVNAEADARERMDLGKHYNDMLAETAALEAQINAALKGADALAAYNVEKEVSALLAGKNADALDEETKKLLAAAEARQKSAKALEAVNRSGSVMDRLYPEAKLMKEYIKDQEALLEARRRAQAANDPAAVAKYTKAIEDLGTEYKTNERAASAWGEFTQGAIDRVDEAFADAWKNVFDGSENLWDGLKDGFKQTLAELAHMAITKPIIVSFGNQLLGTNTKGGIGDVWGSFFGGSSGGGGGGGSGSSLQDGMQMASTARNAYSLYTSGFAGMTSTLGGYVSSLGSMLGMSGVSNFGIGMQGATLAPGLAGPTTMGAGGTMGLGAKFGSTMSGLASNPITWIVAALLGSYQFGQAGYRLDEKQIRDTELAKYSTAIDPLGSVFLDSLITKPVLFGQKTLSPIFGEKWGSILSGGALVSGLHNTLNKALFGGEWKTKDFGIGLGIEGGELDAQQFEYRKKKGGLFSSSKKKTIWKDLDPETQAALDETYEATEKNVSELFKELGIVVEDGSLAGLKLARTQISTKGKTEEEIQKAVADWFGTAASAMTAELNKVFATGLDVDFAGMQAFVGNLLGVNDLLKTIQLAEFEASVAGGKMAEHLADVAGGFEALSASVGTYYQAFFTEQEQFDAALKAAEEQFKEQFEAIDVQAPISSAAFREMIENIDITTEAGREMFATMVALAGQTDAYFKLVAQNNANTLATQMNGANSAFALVQRSIAAEQQRLTLEYQRRVAEADAAAQAYAQAAQAASQARAASLQALASQVGERVNAITSIIGALDSALERLRDTSEETTAQLRSQAVATLQQALAGVKSGKSIVEFPGIEDALDRAADVDAGTFGSLEAFKREQGRTANLVAELKKVAGVQLTAEEKVLASLEAQLNVARSSASASGGYYSASRAAMDAEYQLEMEKLQEEMDEAQRQMDALNGIDNSVMSVVDAVNAMSAAVTAAMKTMGLGSNPAAPAESTAAMVDRMYKAIAGFAPDAGGIHYWTDQLTTGKSSYADFVKALEGARKVPAFAAGGVHMGGLRLVGENGPELEVTGPSRIYNASQTAAMLSGGASAEVKALRTDFAHMGDALRSIAKHTERTARRVEFLERWDGDGMPGERTA